METNPELVPEFSIRFQFSVVRAAAMASNKPAVFVLDGVFTRNVGIDDSPEVGVGNEGGREGRCRCWSLDTCRRDTGRTRNGWDFLFHFFS